LIGIEEDNFFLAPDTPRCCFYGAVLFSELRS